MILLAKSTLPTVVKILQQKSAILTVDKDLLFLSDEIFLLYVMEMKYIGRKMQQNIIVWP